MVSFKEEVLAEIHDRAASLEYAAGETVFIQGDIARCLMVILAGTVEVATAKDAANYRVIAYRSANDIIGEMALVMRQPRSARVRANTKLRVSALPRASYYELAARSPLFLEWLEQLTISRLRTEKMHAIAARTYGEVVWQGCLKVKAI